jgi:TRAP-type C4-dicarboxylate transport system substrate-binding protein
VFGPSVGAVVISKKQLDAIAADLRQILMDTGKVAANALRNRIRTEDAAALARLKDRTTVVTLMAEERNGWSGRFTQTRELLAQGTFTPELVTRLESMA